MLSDDEAKLRDSARDERHLHDGASTTSEAEPIPSSNHRAIDSLGTARQTSPASNPSASSDSSDEAIGKWLKFWRGVLHIDTSKMDLGVGFRNALGVALPLAVGIAIKMPLGGLAVASGALNVSYSDGHDPYWQRAKRMLATSALCAVAVMAGGLSGHYSVVAVLLSSFWAFWAGFVIALGRRPKAKE